MGDFFGATTDYILKLRIEPVADKEQKNKELTSKALIYHHQLCCYWAVLHLVLGMQNKQWKSLGFNDYSSYRDCWIFYSENTIGRKNPLCKLLNIIGVAFMPISMITGYISDWFSN